MLKSPKTPTNSAKRQTMILLIFAIVLLLVGGGGISAIQSKQSAADAVVAKRQSEVGTSEEIARRYQATLDNYNQTIAQLRYVEPTIAKQAYVPTMVQQLQRLATSDHLKLVSVRPGSIVDPAPAAGSAAASNTANDKEKKAPPAPYKTMVVMISVEGTYKQIMAFVYHMTRFPKIVMIQSLTLSPRGSTPGLVNVSKTPLLGAEISLQAYLFDDVPSSAPATAGGLQNPLAAVAGKLANLAVSDNHPGGLGSHEQAVKDAAAQGRGSVGKGGQGNGQDSVR